MNEVRVSVSDALFEIARYAQMEPGSRYALRRILRKFADSAWADGYTEACRDRADEKADAVAPKEG